MMKFKNSNIQFFFILIISILVLVSCMSEPDKYPELPFLEDIVDDSEDFTFIIDDDYHRIFLKNGLFLNRNNQFTIETPEGKEVFRIRLNAGMTRYMDSIGNIYYNQLKYKAPDYKKIEPIVMIDIGDSVADYAKEIYKENLVDSIEEMKIRYYASKLRSKYDLFLDDEVIRFKKDTLILYNVEEFCNFIKEPEPFEEFDDRIQIKSHSTGGHFGLPCFDHFYYFTVGKNKIKFKYQDKHALQWKKYTMNGKTYVYNFFGKLYLVND
ncbi:hypothetical protein U8527_08085 [Kordia algicida OT-1]